ncbi:MAG: hypothetical protein H8E66_15510 [Planctomycetes bacterium]|nr:hypothetical protein [Planctomycetota bacterium]
MQSIAIITLAILAAVTYGVLHDQVTARVCVEYFTIGHPPLFTFETKSPTLLAFGWGVAATWWVGLILGILLAFVSRAGQRPKVHVNELYRPLGLLMFVAAVAALASGVLGYTLSANEVVNLVEPLRSQIPPSKHSLFIADLWAHTASYVVAFCGGLILIVYTRQNRLVRQ